MSVEIYVNLRTGEIDGSFTVDDKLPLIDAMETIAAALIHGGLARLEYVDGTLSTIGRG